MLPAGRPGTSSGLVYKTHSPVPTAMNKIIGNAKVRMDAPKVHALPAGAELRKCTGIPFFGC
jgi:hypothetical protein